MWYPQSAQKGNNLNAFTARNPIFLTVWRELILLVISGTSHARDSCLVFGLLTALNSWLAMSHEIWWQSNRGCLDIPLEDRATWRLLCEISRTERGLDTPFRISFLWYLQYTMILFLSKVQDWRDSRFYWKPRSPMTPNKSTIRSLVQVLIQHLNRVTEIWFKLFSRGHPYKIYFVWTHTHSHTPAHSL